MELRHLRYVVTLARELNFGRAAAQLHISQPPLSQQIRHLEEELGVTLFNRTRRSVELTEAGRAFVAEARQALAQADRAAAAAIAASRGEIGSLTLGTVTTTDSGFYRALITILRAFSTRYPKVRLRLQTLSPQQQVEALLDGRIDAGFVTLPLTDARLVIKTVRGETLAVALPEGHALTKRKTIPAAALAGERHVLMPRHVAPGFYDVLVSFYRSVGFTLTTADEADGIYTSLALVAAGRGVAVLPTSILEIARPGIAVRPLEPPSPVFEVGAAHLAANQSPVVRSFMEVVHTVVAAAQKRSPQTRRLRSRLSQR